MKRIHEYNKFKEGSDKATDFSLMLWWIIGGVLNDETEMTEEAIRELKSFEEHYSTPPQELKDFCEHLMSEQGWEATHNKFPQFMEKYPDLGRALTIYVYS